MTSAKPNAIEEIKRLYFGATRQTITADLDRAVRLLTSLPSEDERARAAVYMDGLAQMRSEWGVRAPTPNSTRPPRRPPARAAARTTSSPATTPPRPSPRRR